MSDHDIFELDEELLALAGGESEAEEEAEVPKALDDDDDDDRIASRRSRTRSLTRTPPPKEAPKLPSPSPLPVRGVAQKRKAKKGAVKRSTLMDESEEEEEEGEASDAPGSPDSQGSAAMEESDSDDDEDSAPLGADDDVLYPLEGKFRSERDRAEIMGMSEFQRETILAERAAEIDKRNQDRQLRRMLQAQEKSKAADGKKRKAGIADLEDDSSRRSKVKSVKNERLESYVRQREQRNQQRRKDEARRANTRRSPRSQSRESSRDAEGESEPEYEDRVPVKDDPPVYRDYDLVRVGRSNFAKVCFYPDFEEAIVGCFARVSIGLDRATGQNVYRMAQIKGFAEGKPYAMEVGTTAFKRTIVTDQYAILAHGKAEKEWPFIACSDSKITDSEFDKWKRTIQTDNLRQPPKRFLVEKLNRIHQLLNRTWTDESLKQKFERQNKYAKFTGPVIGMAALQQKSSPEKKPMSQGERLAELNRQNRQKNIEEIRRAQIVEKKKEKLGQKLMREKAEKEAREKAEKEASKGGLQVPSVDDLFEGGSDISRGGTPQPGAGEKKEKKKLEIKGIPTFRKRNMDDDILGSMDLGIDIEI